MKQYRFKIGGRDYAVTISSVEGTQAKVNVNGVDYEVELENAPSVSQAPVSAPVSKPEAAPVDAAPAKAEPAASTAGAASGAGRKVCSPLPGVIISIDVKEGQSIRRGDKVAVLEAMKMENDILAECDGTVSSIRVSKGDSLLEGAEICTIA